MRLDREKWPYHDVSYLTCSSTETDSLFRCTMYLSSEASRRRHCCLGLGKTLLGKKKVGVRKIQGVFRITFFFCQVRDLCRAFGLGGHNAIWRFLIFTFTQTYPFTQSPQHLHIC